MLTSLSFTNAFSEECNSDSEYRSEGRREDCLVSVAEAIVFAVLLPTEVFAVISYTKYIRM